MPTTRSGQHGDTLVEVLIVTLIVAIMMAGAYVSVFRSSQGVRDSQEHAEALKLLQSQLEQIRLDTTDADQSAFDTPEGGEFCMIDAAVAHGEGCTRTAGNDQAPADSQPAYKLTVRRNSCAPLITRPDCSIFRATAQWDSITNKSVVGEQISMRLYKSGAALPPPLPIVIPTP